MSFTGRAPRAVLLRFKRIASKPCEHSPLRSLAQRPPRCIRRALRLHRLGEIRRHWQPGRRAWTHPPPVTSYASSSSDLSDKLRFPRFSRTALEFSLAARGLVRLITDLGWRTMILHHDVGFVLSLFDT